VAAGRMLSIHRHWPFRNQKPSSFEKAAGAPLRDGGELLSAG